MTDIMRAMVLFAIITNAGGEGKTTIAVFLEALLDLLGYKAFLVDVDQGMGSLNIRSQDVINLDWGMTAKAAPRVYAALQNHDVIFDTGANFLASGAGVVDLFWTLKDMFKSDGYRIVCLVPLSPNKAGAAGAALDLLPKLAAFDGSRAYDADLAGHATLKLEHLDTGYQTLLAMWQSEGLSLADVIRQPPAGYRLAVDVIAEVLSKFAQQPAITDLVGGDVTSVLAGLGRLPSEPMRFVGLSPDKLTDTQIQLFRRKSRYYNALDKHGFTPESVQAFAEACACQGGF
jgi:CobQ/CobB/MinD/ParA nucleotide binding domain